MSREEGRSSFPFSHLYINIRSTTYELCYLEQVTSLPVDFLNCQVAIVMVVMVTMLISP